MSLHNNNRLLIAYIESNNHIAEMHNRIIEHNIEYSKRLNDIYRSNVMQNYNFLNERHNYGSRSRNF